MLALLLVSLAAAGPPEGLLPLVDRPGLQVDFAQAAWARGGGAEDAALACRPFAESLILCFTVREGTGRRLVTLRDLAAWEADLSAVERAATAGAAAGLGPARPEPVAIEGDSRSYLLSAVGDGLDQAGLLHPDALAARFGGKPFAVGIPAQGVLLAVALGDPELEQMVAVGVRRLWESAEQPITATLYTWDGAAWLAWGEARPTPTRVPRSLP